MIRSGAFALSIGAGSLVLIMPESRFIGGVVVVARRYLHFTVALGHRTPRVRNSPFLCRESVAILREDPAAGEIGGWVRMVGVKMDMCTR